MEVEIKGLWEKILESKFGIWRNLNLRTRDKEKS